MNQTGNVLYAATLLAGALLATKLFLTTVEKIDLISAALKAL